MQMNLFRSEEHVKHWSLYDPASEEAIMPMTDWARLFAGQMFRRRLDPDYFARLPEYRSEFGQILRELGKTGPFWGGR